MSTTSPLLVYSTSKTDAAITLGVILKNACDAAKTEVKEVDKERRMILMSDSEMWLIWDTMKTKDEDWHGGRGI